MLKLPVCEWWISAGHIDAAEIQDSLRNIGVTISLEDATRILQRSANSIASSLCDIYKCKKHDSLLPRCRLQ